MSVIPHGPFCHCDACRTIVADPRRSAFPLIMRAVKHGWWVVDLVEDGVVMALPRPENMPYAGTILCDYYGRVRLYQCWTSCGRCLGIPCICSLADCQRDC